jgi:peptidoglycan/xylan/chitin deacetylase (PgdA/CDA1 family)
MTDAIPILMCHSISDAATPRFASCALPPAQFREQMAYLHREGYTPITVSELATCLDARSSATLPARPVVLTFDDAYEDFYTDAFPVLREYGFAATLYVVTAFVNGRARWLHYERETHRPMISWGQLREIADQGIECGSHTRVHPQVDTLPRQEAWDEIRTSKDDLEQQLGRPVTTFAYPYGHFDAATRAMVAEAGYSAACAVKIAMSSPSDDRFALARVMPMPDMDITGYAQMLEGRGVRVAPLAPRWQRRIRDRVRRSIVKLERRLGLEGLEIEYRTRVHPG